jgi:hypothetical protein
MVMIIVVVIIIIISRIKRDEMAPGTSNKFMSWLELHKTALHARVRNDITYWCGFILHFKRVSCTASIAQIKVYVRCVLNYQQQQHRVQVFVCPLLLNLYLPFYITDGNSLLLSRETLSDFC